MLVAILLVYAFLGVVVVVGMALFAVVALTDFFIQNLLHSAILVVICTMLTAGICFYSNLFWTGVGLVLGLLAAILAIIGSEAEEAANKTHIRQ